MTLTYTLSLHDALPIYRVCVRIRNRACNCERAGSEFRILKYTHGAIPYDRFRLPNDARISANGLGTNIQTHLIIGSLGDGSYLRSRSLQTRRDDVIHRKLDSDFLRGRFG